LTAPEALLPFLAHWVAWPIDRRWDTKQQRRFIRNAVELYRWHGTRQGLRFYLHLYTELPLDEDLPEAEKHISIEEIFYAGFCDGRNANRYGFNVGRRASVSFYCALASRTRSTD
jgi:phage tail-like protein